MTALETNFRDMCAAERHEAVTRGTAAFWEHVLATKFAPVADALRMMRLHVRAHYAPGCEFSYRVKPWATIEGHVTVHLTTPTFPFKATLTVTENSIRLDNDRKATTAEEIAMALQRSVAYALAEFAPRR